MKIKFWQFEYEFDRDDAKIVIPILLLLIAIISIGGVNPLWLLAATAVYYLLYFFSESTIAAIRAYLARWNTRCPHCKSRKIILQGYQGYKSDEQYPFYFCDECETTSILTGGGLLKIK